MVGAQVATIRKPYHNCVDIRKNGKLLRWWSLEYVLKHPETFIPITICRNAGIVTHQQRITQKPYQVEKFKPKK